MSNLDPKCTSYIQPNWRSDFTTLAILLIPIAVALNFVGGELATLLKLPVYLDAIGTIFTAMICGPYVGAMAGLLTNILTGITNPINFAFLPINVLVGLIVGFLACHKMFSSWPKLLLSTFIISIVSIFTSSVIVVLVYGGVTGGGTSLIAMAAMAAGANIWAAVIGTEGIWTVIDRLIALGLSFMILGVLPSRTLIKFKCGAYYLKENK